MGHISDKRATILLVVVELIMVIFCIIMYFCVLQEESAAGITIFILPLIVYYLFVYLNDKRERKRHEGVDQTEEDKGMMTLFDKRAAILFVLVVLIMLILCIIFKVDIM